MELIPILSLIMLVATIATFVLAIGAYILYKIRERNGRLESENQKDTVQAELVTPSQVLTESRTPNETYTGDLLQSRGMHKSGHRMRTTYVAPIYTNTENQSSKQTTSTQVKDRMTNQKKYLRYTQDGYVEPGKDDNKESILKWR